MKPEGYPLPWNDEFDMPWFHLNSWMILIHPGYREWQGPKPMSYLIPVIQWLLESTPLIQRLLESIPNEYLPDRPIA